MKRADSTHAHRRSEVFSRARRSLTKAARFCSRSQASLAYLPLPDWRATGAASDPGVAALAQFHIPLGGETFLSVGAATALVVVAIAFYVLHFTRFGRRVYAIGGSEQSALLMGLPVARTKITVYAVSGFCSALAGLVFVLYIQSGDPLHAIGMELDAIAAVVIGGTVLTGGSGYIIGSLLGVLVLGLIKTIISDEGTFSSWWIKIFTGVLLLLFILLQRVIGATGRQRAG